MSREVRFEVPVDTSFFTPLQMQPRTALALAWNGTAAWLRAHLVSFPELIGRERTGLVIMTIAARYDDDVRFFDCPAVGVTTSLAAFAAGSRVRVRTGLTCGERAIGEVVLLLCPVAIEEPASLAACPAPLADRLLARLADDERGAEPLERAVPGLVERATAHGRLLGEGEESFVVDRHLCEVADQWSFVEIPSLTEASRNALAFARMAAEPLLRRALERRLERLDVELARPYFSFDRGRVRCRAYELGAELVFVHELLSGGAPERRHGFVVERFAAG